MSLSSHITYNDLVLGLLMHRGAGLIVVQFLRLLRKNEMVRRHDKRALESWLVVLEEEHLLDFWHFDVIRQIHLWEEKGS